MAESSLYKSRANSVLARVNFCPSSSMGISGSELLARERKTANKYVTCMWSDSNDYAESQQKFECDCDRNLHFYF